ncbi:predicted protein [Postia placenta Mad-698-R]|nr:predicted protein [Postia placenta Mad-698-R]
MLSRFPFDNIYFTFAKTVFRWLWIDFTTFVVRIVWHPKAFGGELLQATRPLVRALGLGRPPTTIHSLPYETLAHIFALGRDPSPCKTCSQAPWRLREGKPLALNTPQLWTTVPVTSKATMSMMSEYLGRSGGRPIDVNILEDLHFKRNEVVVALLNALRIGGNPDAPCKFPCISSLRFEIPQTKTEGLPEVFGGHLLEFLRLFPAVEQLAIQGFRTDEIVRSMTSTAPPDVVLPGLKRFVMLGHPHAEHLDSAETLVRWRAAAGASISNVFLIGVPASNLPLYTNHYGLRLLLGWQLSPKRVLLSLVTSRAAPSYYGGLHAGADWMQDEQTRRGRLGFYGPYPPYTSPLERANDVTKELSLTIIQLSTWALSFPIELSSPARTYENPTAGALASIFKTVFRRLYSNCVSAVSIAQRFRCQLVLILETVRKKLLKYTPVLALNTPRLWTVVPINSRATTYTVLDYLGRSGVLPIEIDIRVPGPDMPFSEDELLGICTLLAWNSERWRQRDVPILEVLDVDVPLPGPEIPLLLQQWPEVLLQKGAPRLREIHIMQGRLTEITLEPLAVLDTLVLMTTHWNLPRLKHLADTSPLITHLSLYCLTMSNAPQEDAVETMVGIPLLSMLTAPLLEVLQLEELSFGTEVEARMLLNSLKTEDAPDALCKFPRILSVRFEIMQMKNEGLPEVFGGHLLEFLHLFPLAEHLAVQGCRIEDIMVCITPPNITLPRLERITLLAPLSEEYLSAVDALRQQRQKIGMPVPSVHIIGMCASNMPQHARNYETAPMVWGFVHFLSMGTQKGLRFSPMSDSIDEDEWMQDRQLSRNRLRLKQPDMLAIMQPDMLTLMLSMCGLRGTDDDNVREVYWALQGSSVSLGGFETSCGGEKGVGENGGGESESHSFPSQRDGRRKTPAISGSAGGEDIGGRRKTEVEAKFRRELLASKAPFALVAFGEMTFRRSCRESQSAERHVCRRLLPVQTWDNLIIVIAKLGDVCVPVLDVLVRGTIAICGNQLRMTLAEGALQNKATAYTRHPYQWNCGLNAAGRETFQDACKVSQKHLERSRTPPWLDADLSYGCCSANGHVGRRTQGYFCTEESATLLASGRMDNLHSTRIVPMTEGSERQVTRVTRDRRVAPPSQRSALGEVEQRFESCCNASLISLATCKANRNMETDSVSLVVPITFRSSITGDAPETNTNNVARSWASASASCLTAWGCSDASEQPDLEEKLPSHGLAFGCDDGTVFLFGSQLAFPRKHDIPGSPTNTPPEPAEQVEAPKNYVDFDDEPEKLKGMLRGKATRSELLSPDVDRTAKIDRLSVSTSTRSIKAFSPAASLRSLSPPSSPCSPTANSPAQRETGLFLKSHILPSSLGSTHAVAALEAYDDGSITSGVKAASDASILWIWQTIQVGSVGEARLVVASASGDTSYMSQSIDVAEGDAETQTRILVCELREGPQLDGSDMALVKKGDWVLDGPAESVGFYQEMDGTLAVHYMSSDHRLVIRILSFNEELSPPDIGDMKSNSTTMLPLPNPFKAFKNLSRERLSGETGNDDASELSLSAVISLHLVQSDRGGDPLVIGGSDDGSIGIWSAGSLTASEVTSQLMFVCISVVLVPASVAPLKMVHMREDDILLVYTDNRARLWDCKTMEFRRSMNKSKADELLGQGAWAGWPAEPVKPSVPVEIVSLPVFAGLDSACSLLLDMGSIIHSNTGHMPGRTSASKHDRGKTRSILATLLTPGISKEIDDICTERLRVYPSCASVGYHEFSSQAVWSISPEISAFRAVILVTLLQVLIDNDDASTMMTFYVASLPEAIGPSYQSPSLTFLAKYYLRSSVQEVRSAARLLFDAGVARLSNDDTILIVEKWKEYLPSVQKERDTESVRSAMALHMCGFVAAEKYNLLSTNVLTETSKSIGLYLHREGSPYRALAIELCSRGFTLWQQYVDAVEMLRAVCTLATVSRKEAISIHNVGSQARSAVLHIAAANTPLFMTTLTIDILQPRSVEHRKAVMQLVIFLIRKNPLVLYSNLPRLVEAVVKSLDPNSTSNRDAVLDSATDILGHIVQTFPNVDFHMSTQRLAMGTAEGAVVMYDLKTATRLYVLEGHKKRTTACSFSPDGRRLVTVSLEESVVLVWKVGSSLTSFFNPGAPPRQGHGGSDPYKTLSFNIGSEAHMTLAATLEAVRFEWPADRSNTYKTLYCLDGLNQPTFPTSLFLEAGRTSMIVPLITAAIFSASNGRFKIPFIDALFMCISAGTGTGLTTIDLSSMSVWQQAIIVVLGFIGNQVFVTWAYFTKHLKHIVTAKLERRSPQEDPFLSEHSVVFPRILPENDLKRRRAEMDELVSATVTHRPCELFARVIGRIFPQFYRSVQRRLTIPRTKMLVPHTPGGSPPRSAHHVPYISFNAIVDRNSVFKNLTEENIQELGGLLSVLPGFFAEDSLLTEYYLGLLVISFIVIIPYMSLPGWHSVMHPPEQHRMINTVWFSTFQVVGAWANTGMSLVNQNMVPYRTTYPMITVFTLCVLAGNAAYTWLLLAIQLVIGLIALSFNLLLNPAMDHIPIGVRLINAVLQSSAVRSVVFQSAPVLSFVPAVQEDDNAEGVDSPNDAASGPRVAIWGQYLCHHVRKQLSFDMWWLALSLFVLCIIERAPLMAAEDATRFPIFALIFELVSAYGTVGLSLGVPYVRMIRTTYGTGHPLIVVGELLAPGGFAPSFEDRRTAKSAEMKGEEMRTPSVDAKRNASEIPLDADKRSKALNIPI